MAWNLSWRTFCSSPSRLSVLCSLFVLLEIIVSEIDAFQMTQATEGDISSLRTNADRAGGDSDARLCYDKRCQWHQYCVTRFVARNNTATVSCKPCYPVCDGDHSDDCKSLCPDVWDMLKNESSHTVRAKLKDAETWEKTVYVPPWNIKARVITGTLGAVAACLFVLGIQKSFTLLENYFGVQPREDEDCILEDHRHGMVLTDERISAVEAHDQRPPASPPPPASSTSGFQEVVLQAPPATPASPDDIHIGSAPSAEGTRLKNTGEETPYGAVKESDKPTDAAISGHM